MGGYSAVIFIGVIVALALVVRGAFAQRRSMTVALITLPLAVVAAGCAWYAFTESQSLPWTIGYVVTALLSIGVGLKHLAGNKASHDQMQD
jgi:cytochrome bd-type quinol oxidase subunit 1